VKDANRRGIGKIVYASTWEVYGEPKYEPLDEKHPCNPDHPYSIAKYAGELMVRNTLNRIPWLILRLGSAYGTGMRPHAVIPLFIRKALNGEPITLQNGGVQLRQFTHTRDVGRAFFKAVHASVSGEVFNIVIKSRINQDIAQYVTSRIPAASCCPKPEGDVPSARVVCAKAQRFSMENGSSLHEG
jgi:UDP-glucose 4-epimerase